MILNDLYFGQSSTTLHNKVEKLINEKNFNTYKARSTMDAMAYYKNG